MFLFLLISGQEKTEKMDKTVSVQKFWFIYQVIDLKTNDFSR